MSCEEFVATLSVSPRPTLQLALHAERCPQCARLAHADVLLRAAGPSMPARLPEAGAQLQQLFATGGTAPALCGGASGGTERQAARVTHPLRRITAVLAIVSLCVAVAVCCLPRADLRAAATAPLVLPFAVLALLLAAGLQLYTYRGRTGLGVPPWLRWAFAVGAVALFEGLVALESAHDAAWNASLGAARVAASNDCLVLGLAVACLVGAVTLAVGRRMALVAAASSGALAGSVAGLAALMFLHVHCAASAAGHLAVVHVLPLVCAIAVGAFAGRRILAA